MGSESRLQVTATEVALDHALYLALNAWPYTLRNLPPLKTE